MAKFPDGTILMYKPNHKTVSVEVETAALVKCKNCIFCSRALINEHAEQEYCIEYAVWTNHEGYCWKAVRKDDNDGR